MIIKNIPAWNLMFAKTEAYKKNMRSFLSKDLEPFKNQFSS